jgi:2-polyprenyl-3-methyl-5-hydroxy-6-metoxy-1,4-benzoquinol methylase
MSVKTTTLCNLCGRGRFSIVEDFEKPVYVLKCLHCGLVFVDPQPEPSLLAAHYGEDYYRDWLGPKGKRRLRMWKGRLRTIEKKVPKGRLLDVGCGAGEFLSLAKESGWVVEGTELSPYSAALVSDRLKMQIFSGNLMNAGLEHASFDVITFWHVLEHVPDPVIYLREAHRLIKPSGLLVVAVPNLDDMVMRIAYRIVKGRPLRLYSKDDREVHLYYFQAETLQLIFRKTGFLCLTISPDYGITETSKRLVNLLSVVLSALTGRKLYNALEIHGKRL